MQCKNLASHLLGKVLRQFPRDFERRYGYEPWVVETFVGPDQRGTCFRAAGFQLVGQTSGRGRHAPTNACTKTRKDVFVYDLGSSWKDRLGVPHVDAWPTLEIGEGLDSETWAMQEWGAADLGDKRLAARLVTSMDILSRMPGVRITANLEANQAVITGYYRFIKKADERGITPEKVLEPSVRYSGCASAIRCCASTTGRG